MTAAPVLSPTPAGPGEPGAADADGGRRPPLVAHWFLPTYGDSRGLVGGGHGMAATAATAARPASLGYLSQIARAAETVGFEGALTPTGAWCEDAWLTTAMLAAHSERLKFLVAFRPGLVSPTLAAQMAATFQRHSGGRLLLNVVTGGEAREQRAYGDHLGKDDRYRRCGEFLEVVRGLWRGKTVSLAGEHVQVEEARLERAPDPVPPLYFGGSSPLAGEVAARHSDVYLTWGEPPAAVAEKVAWIRRLAAAEGRTVRFGIRLHVITRDSSDAAWAQAEQLLAGIPAGMIEDVQASLARSESEGQRRMRALHSGGSASAGDLEVSPNLWAGVGLVRGGAGTALVGSHQEVADRIAEYHALGIDEFVLSGHPHLEEAYWVGEGVLPELGRRGLWAPPAGSAAATPVAAAVPFAGSAR
ncbi:LLM class flavin-dependent oxidoreductase [Modestobacter sp. I12A-02628]|uniref:LLM class flavin-dependent oxidoreductase n=1 Tax=Goekera deserti TaxID=2497753 RepID=A0A7K3WAI6_9ACTN|nr:LLM class flavin-dependent oxidoreductase [Goekera deserti]MPQ99201.1 LLM class flavin-dependent oxidoreductase [Goekera deserti]NDI47536.1 LLM class flavin-dependent oxidoreductase [Goekera deserti]NEL53347.1 LLM class flavin-dependent oxidoreductase [Goekera deserti]